MELMFPHLYSPIKIGSLTLKNRIVSAPTSQNDIEPDGTLADRNIAYYERKAAGGCAMVTIGDGIVHPSGQDHQRQLYLYTDNCLPSLKRCAEAIHRHNCYACMELSHGGIVCDPEFINGARPFGPSEVPVAIGFSSDTPVYTTSEPLTVEMMDELADAYADSAVRVKKAGFDMVLVHAAHGWLIGQFFSPDINLRTDEYGGSLENRCRFAIMVLTRIREKVGKDFPIALRINGFDFTKSGLTSEDSVQICKILEPYVDSFHVSGSVIYKPETADNMHSNIFMEHGHLLKYAAATKNAVSKPVTTVGGYSDLAMMDEVIAGGKADIIAVARQLLADPDFVRKGRDGRPDLVKKCLRCMNCQSRRFSLGTARCAINPEIGHEAEFARLLPSNVCRKVVIVGGGPGGMQAAVIAAQRGHKVVLFEKTDRLGGALNFARVVPFKAELYSLVKTLEAQMKELPIDVRLGLEATPDMVAAEAPDVVFVAVGAEPLKLKIPGFEKAIIAEDLEKYDIAVGDSVIVIGGGLVGCEEAIHQALQGKKVTLIEMRSEIACDANFRYIKSIRKKIEECGVDVRVNTACLAVTDTGVLVKDENGEEHSIPADTVISAAGMVPRRDLAETFRGIAPELIEFGNCVSLGEVKEAIHVGYTNSLYLT